ncbi:MAG: ester cyclase, partial [Betaproteobacteria bacterium]|nr:ester cyclase [Betaproteobacteria bacterium]
EDPNRIAVAWRWTGTFLADLPGFKATGKPVKTSGITNYYMKGDRIAGHWQVSDRLGMLQQVSQS